MHVKAFIVNIDSPRRNQFKIGQTIKEAANAINLEPHEDARGKDSDQAYTKQNPDGMPKMKTDAYALVWNQAHNT